MPPLIWPAVAAALLAGAALGWALRGARPASGTADWQTRIAARDRDLERSREEAADLAVALQGAEARIADLLGRSETDDPGIDAAEARRQRARADALAERLRAADDEIATLRGGSAGGPQGIGDPGPVRTVEVPAEEPAANATRAHAGPRARRRAGALRAAGDED